MPVLLDTDVAIEILRGNEYALGQIAAFSGDVFVSSITAAELFYGACHSRQVERNVETVRSFLSQFRRLTLTDGAARRFGEMKESLRRKSTPADAFDLLIAAIALEHGCALATGNAKHFSKVDGLRLVDWRRPSAALA